MSNVMKHKKKLLEKERKKRGEISRGVSVINGATPSSLLIAPTLQPGKPFHLEQLNDGHDQKRRQGLLKKVNPVLERIFTMALTLVGPWSSRHPVRT